MNIVDLSYTSKKSKKLDKELNLIFKNYQKIFTNLVNKAGAQTKDNLDIWLSLPLSRNTLISHLYYNFCLAIFVKKNIKENSKVDQIIVDSPELAKILETYFKKIKIKTKINYKKIFLLSKLLNFLINFIKFFIKKTYQFLIARITKKNTKKIIKDKIILIDTFALPGFYNKDRYFNGLTRYLKKEQIKKIFFLPTITYTSVKNYYNAYKQIRESQNQVIIKEDFLNFFDLFFSLLHSIRVKFFYFEKLNCEGLDFSKLFNSELKNGIGDDMAVEGLLNYRFIKRLKEKKIQLDLLVDWWENQAMDKGLNKAAQTYYPNSKVIGYLGYFPREFELQLATSKLESKLKYTPKIIAVTGNKIKKKINMFNKQQKVIIAPAFRYSYLWNKKQKNKKKK